MAFHSPPPSGVASDGPKGGGLWATKGFVIWSYFLSLLGLQYCSTFPLGPWLPYYQNCHVSNDKTLGANILGRQLWLQHMGSGWFFWFLKIQFWSWPERADWEAPLPLEHLHGLWFLGPRNPAGGAPPKSFLEADWDLSIPLTFDFDSGSSCWTRNRRVAFGRSLLQPRPHCSKFWQVLSA